MLKAWRRSSRSWLETTAFPLGLIITCCWGASPRTSIEKTIKGKVLEVQTGDYFHLKIQAGETSIVLTCFERVCDEILSMKNQGVGRLVLAKYKKVERFVPEAGESFLFYKVTELKVISQK